jgi:hypothetical protein
MMKAETQAELVERFRGTTMRATSTQYELLKDHINPCGRCGYWTLNEQLDDDQQECEACREEV